MADIPEHHKRDLLLSENITCSAVRDTIKDIFDINADDDQKSELYRDWDRTPIRLFINSFGGSVYDGLALIDVIHRSKTPVYTICVGSCMSMGLWIFLAGSKRLIGENATLMFHDISFFHWDKLEGIKQNMLEMERLRSMIIGEVVRKTLVKEEHLMDYITRKADWYISASEAITLQFADEYYV